MPRLKKTIEGLHPSVTIDGYHKRIRRGWSHEKAISTPAYHQHGKGELLRDECQRHGVHVRTYQSRRRRGMTHKEALSGIVDRGDQVYSPWLQPEGTKLFSNLLGKVWKPSIRHRMASGI